LLTWVLCLSWVLGSVGRWRCLLPLPDPVPALCAPLGPPVMVMVTGLVMVTVMVMLTVMVLERC
jgi:hypothetical protein